MTRYRLAGRRRPVELAGRTVLVTGASSGIGAATARRVSAAGATTILVARRADQLEAAAAGLEHAHVHPADLTDADAVADLVARVTADHGGVDFLVNNAGRSIRRSLALSTDRFHDVERTMAINFFAPVRLTLALLPGMRERGFGHVVNVLSWGVQLRAPKFSAYLASKSALDTWSRVAARETLADGVTFTNMRLGAVRTPMLVPTGGAEDRRQLDVDEAAALVERALRERPVTVNHPLGTPGELLTVLAPRLSDAGMNRLHRRTPDTAAARGTR
ncbi:NAD(P)-dependent dehydrogenase (short-subunit alcohol dehydrogenase family) [Nocardioides ginsengisegetis]|uniref:NAD(P)-dependent dehydrogenase (Short-subunit alcohol dehydrogenase family) n=1 Tax=Nocardioides ginsengisegetis TaxID=661491 RepID=A0A7W3J1G1_9ACTN|nr:SDR family NAD(P)-dependent oxidoreductase [Nocardioides sp. LS1]MBA8804439.1 NAD(P)-dependent dehydrogenase (short-subunit alcohol dehydrogenase family) [Nocardioides ginsengisegetis]GCD91001.1 hypothetical protein NLS1_30070 [Nocardioides sp. LS1]